VKVDVGAARLGALRVDLELALTHDAMTVETRVLDAIDSLLKRSRPVIARPESLEEISLALELRKEDRVAAGQAHRRGAPLGPRREVNLIAPFALEDHVRKPGAIGRGVVTRGALIRCDELLLGLLMPDRDGVVVGLRRKAGDLGESLRRQLGKRF